MIIDRSSKLLANLPLASWISFSPDDGHQPPAPTQSTFPETIQSVAVPVLPFREAAPLFKLECSTDNVKWKGGQVIRKTGGQPAVMGDLEFFSGTETIEYIEKRVYNDDTDDEEHEYIVKDVIVVASGKKEKEKEVESKQRTTILNRPFSIFSTIDHLVPPASPPGLNLDSVMVSSASSVSSAEEIDQEPSSPTTPAVPTARDNTGRSTPRSAKRRGGIFNDCPVYADPAPHLDESSFAEAPPSTSSRSSISYDSISSHMLSTDHKIDHSFETTVDSVDRRLLPASPTSSCSTSSPIASPRPPTAILNLTLPRNRRKSKIPPPAFSLPTLPNSPRSMLPYNITRTRPVTINLSQSHGERSSSSLESLAAGHGDHLDQSSRVNPITSAPRLSPQHQLPVFSFLTSSHLFPTSQSTSSADGSSMFASPPRDERHSTTSPSPSPPVRHLSMRSPYRSRSYQQFAKLTYASPPPLPSPQRSIGGGKTFVIPPDDPEDPFAAVPPLGFPVDMVEVQEKRKEKEGRKRKKKGADGSVYNHDRSWKDIEGYSRDSCTDDEEEEEDGEHDDEMELPTSITFEEKEDELGEDRTIFSPTTIHFNIPSPPPIVVDKSRWKASDIWSIKQIKRRASEATLRTTPFPFGGKSTNVASSIVVVERKEEKGFGKKFKGIWKNLTASSSSGSSGKENVDVKRK